MSQQNCINPVEVADQLPEAGLRVRAPVHQHSEPVNRKESAVTAPGREHVAAGAGQLEEAHGGGRWQQVKGGGGANGAGDQRSKFPQRLHGQQYLRGVDTQCQGTLQGFVSQDDLSPMSNVGTTEGQINFGKAGDRALLIWKLKKKCSLV